MQILVVEDDRDARELLETMLRVDGYEVTSAADGDEAWSKFEANGFSIVVSDWLMPGTDGLELCRRIRRAETSRYTYIILLTALHGKSNYLEAMRAGVDDFMSKPYDPDELRARLLVAQRIVGLQDRVKRLEGILPTCMYCKRIHDESNAWVKIEDYISRHTEASFSHGVCPECYRDQVQPELDRIRRG